MPRPTLPTGYTSRGAQMGRYSHPGTVPAYDAAGPAYVTSEPAPHDEPRRFYLRAIGPNGDGYDEGGAYWGLGARVYWAHDPATGADLFTRAKDRDEAKDKTRQQYPAATFRA